MVKSMTTPPTAAGQTIGEPLGYFRLPRRGTRDGYGLTEGWYRKRAAAGDIRLVRLRERGAAKGVTLVDRKSLDAFIVRRGEVLGEGEGMNEG